MLADAGIACNVVAALRHDHLFVPAGRADEAQAILQALSAKGERERIEAERTIRHRLLATSPDCAFLPQTPHAVKD
ncbi:MAG: hypothetical protein ACKOED_12755 [Aestuariivirga sp.]|uniref:hypothetical protein n=1 Tax=Aestuariivirga sp. TaxID=2650926 RepID=UPI0038CF586A